MNDNFKVEETTGSSVTLNRGTTEHVCSGIHSDVLLEIRDKDGNLKHSSFQHNLRTNAGANFWHAQLFGSASATAVAKWMAITTDTAAAAAGDTTLTSEETTNGLARVATTPSHTTNATSTTITNTWTYTGSTTKVLAKVGLFDAASAGNLVLETLLSSTGTVNANGDQITVTWTVNY